MFYIKICKKFEYYVLKVTDSEKDKKTIFFSFHRRKQKSLTKFQRTCQYTHVAILKRSNKCQSNNNLLQEIQKKKKDHYIIKLLISILNEKRYEMTIN